MSVFNNPWLKPPRLSHPRFLTTNGHELKRMNPFKEDEKDEEGKPKKERAGVHTV